HVSHERGLARAAHAGDADEAAERDLHGDDLKVVKGGVVEGQCRAGVPPDWHRCPKLAALAGCRAVGCWSVWAGQAGRLPYVDSAPLRDLNPFPAAQVLAGERLFGFEDVRV